MGKRLTNTRELIDTYLAERFVKDELAPSSVPVIRSVLRRWAAFTGTEPVEWTTEDLDRWLANPRLRPNTRKSMLTKLRPFVQWLYDRGLIGRDITRGRRSPKIPKGAPRDIAPDQIHKLLLAVPDERATVIVITMVQVGLRCSDLARVRVDDIDLRRGLLDVRGKGGRGEITHTNPIPAEALDVIHAWLADRGWTSGPLIRSYQRPDRGLTGHTISRLVAGWMRDAGIKSFPRDGMSAHSLRHTCAQHMLDRGAQLREVQFGLGQRTIRSAEIYTRREPPGLRDAMEGRFYLRLRKSELAVEDDWLLGMGR